MGENQHTREVKRLIGAHLLLFLSAEEEGDNFPFYSPAFTRVFRKRKKSSSREERMHHFLVCCSEHQAAGFAQKMPHRNFANGKKGGGKNVCSFFIEIWESSMSAKIFMENSECKKAPFCLAFSFGSAIAEKIRNNEFL